MVFDILTIPVRDKPSGTLSASHTLRERERSIPYEDNPRCPRHLPCTAIIAK